MMVAQVFWCGQEGFVRYLTLCLLLRKQGEEMGRDEGRNGRRGGRVVEARENCPYSLFIKRDTWYEALLL